MLFSAAGKSSRIRPLMRTLFSRLSGGEGRQSERERSQIWTFFERHIISVWRCPKQQPARRAVATSRQRAPLFPAEFFNIIFCIFPANDSISASLASHSTSLSFFKHVPSSKGDGLFWSCQIFAMKSFLCTRALPQEINSHGVRAIKPRRRRTELSIKE